MLVATDATYSGYLAIFGFSSLGRCLSLLLLARIPVYDVESDSIGVRSVAVRPDSASMDVPVLPSLPDDTGTKE